MSVTVHVTETRSGYVSFATQEEADEWLESPDFDAVEWTDYLDSDLTVVTP